VTQIGKLTILDNIQKINQKINESGQTHVSFKSKPDELSLTSKQNPEPEKKGVKKIIAGLAIRFKANSFFYEDSFTEALDKIFKNKPEDMLELAKKYGVEIQKGDSVLNHCVEIGVNMGLKEDIARSIINTKQKEQNESTFSDALDNLFKKKPEDMLELAKNHGMEIPKGDPVLNHCVEIGKKMGLYENFVKNIINKKQKEQFEKTDKFINAFYNSSKNPDDIIDLAKEYNVEIPDKITELVKNLTESGVQIPKEDSFYEFCKKIGEEMTVDKEVISLLIQNDKIKKQKVTAIANLIKLHFPNIKEAKS